MQQAQCENLSGNELTLNLLGNIRPQSSQLAEPLWADPGIKSGISVRELSSSKTKPKKAQAGNSNFVPKSSQLARKKPAAPPLLIFRLSFRKSLNRLCSRPWLRLPDTRGLTHGGGGGGWGDYFSPRLRSSLRLCMWELSLAGIHDA